MRREHRSIASIDAVGKHECQCIMVEAEDSLYLTDDFIPTHNTALLMNILEHIAVDQEIPSLIFSAEMTSQQLTQRLVFSRSKINLSIANSPREWDKLQLSRFKSALTAVKEAPLWIDDRARPKLSEIRAKARRMKREHGIKMIGIDYLQLVKCPTGQTLHSREREVAEISGGLKALGKELGVPILVLAQLNRAVEQRGNNAKPKLSDLRESGSVEQDADVVGLLYREDYGKTEDESENCKGVANLLIAKNRNGATGDVPLTFIANLCRFESGHPANFTPPTESKSRW